MELQISKKEILDKIREIDGVDKIALQSPDGLKDEELEISRYLKKNGYDTYIYPRTFGACDLADRSAKKVGCDLLVHLGHAPMPVSIEMPVIFVPVFIEVDRLEEKIDQNLEEISALGDSIGLVSTVQHVKDLSKVKEFLESKGFDVRMAEGDSRNAYEGQVLGCNFSAAHRIKDVVDGYLFIGTGVFHPKGMALSTEKSVVSIEPFGGKSEVIDREDLLRKRWGQVAKAKDADNFAVILSTKKGQLRLREADVVVEKLEEYGKSVEKIFMDHIFPDHLVNYRSFDAYVVVACPRIPIDDFSQFDKPVLSPGEVDAVLGSDDLSMDEIEGVGSDLSIDQCSNLINLD